MRVVNQASFALNNVCRDEIDRLNAVAEFLPGSLTVIGVPASATRQYDGDRRSRGTGIIDVRGLTLAASGGAQIGVTLAPVIANGTSGEPVATGDGGHHDRAATTEREQRRDPTS
jgi:hypothetical protein